MTTMKKTYEIVGIRYHICDEKADIEEKTRLAQEFVRDLPSGTPLVLMAEPDNPWDEKAIAVYMDYTRLLGYVKHESCDDLHPLLDDDGQADAIVTGNDGHLTVFFTIDQAPDSPILPHSRKRILPPSPLSETVIMPFSQQENSLRIVATRLLRLSLTEENIPLFINLLEAYLPLASLSFSYEDSHWRNETYQMVGQALAEKDALHLSEEQQQRLNDCHNRLHAIQGDFHRSHSKWQGTLFDKQLKALSRDGARVLYQKFSDYYIKGTREVLLAKRLIEERDKLIGWFLQMRWPELHALNDHHRMAAKLNYLGVSRRELYDVYSAILLIDQLEIMLGNKKAPKTKTDESQLLFSEKAIVSWERLKADGFVDDEYKPTDIVTRQDKMLIADLFSDRLGIKSKWSVFEKLWHIEHLAQEKQNWKDCKTCPAHEDAIKKIFAIG